MTEEQDSKTPHDLVTREVIIVRPKERTPREQRIMEISAHVGTSLRENLDRAGTLADFIFAYRGIKLHHAEGISWMWECGEQTEKDALEFFQNDALKKEAVRDAKVVEGLVPALQSANSESPNIQMVLKRIRDRYGYYKYSVIARFPKGVQAENPIFGWTPLELTQTCPDTIYFRPTSACVLHACDDLYKISRGSVLEIPYRSRAEAQRRMEYGEDGVNEYQLKKTQLETVKQDAGNYVTVGLQSAFSNERNVIPVSRFWASQKPKSEK